MNLLCDTHVLLWFLQGETRYFSDKTQQILLDNENKLYFSTASIWEIAIKYSLGKPDFDFEPQIIADELLRQGFQTLAIHLSHTIAVSHLPFTHGDPFDRLLIAQAELEKLQFLTADQKILQYDKPFIVDVR